MRHLTRVDAVIMDKLDFLPFPEAGEPVLVLQSLIGDFDLGALPGKTDSTCINPGFSVGTEATFKLPSSS